MPKRDASYWKDAIRNGQRFQEKYGGARSWRTYKNYYRHKFAQGVLPVNQVFSIMRSMVAQTYPRNPSVTVTPTKPGLLYQLHAKIVESVDRYLLRELNTKHEMKRMIEDAFLCGVAAGFSGYDSEFGWSPSKAEEGAPATLTQFDKKGYKIEYNNYVRPGMPWFLRARPEDVVWPWGAVSKDSSEWVALRILRPLADLKKDRKYNVPRDLNGSHVPYRTGPEGGTTHDTGADLTQMLDEWIELWQIHDAKTGKIHVVTMEHDSFLRSDTDLMQIEGLPAETLIFNPDPDYIYGIPDARIIEPQLLELNEIRTQAMKHRRIDITKLAYLKGSLKPEALTKLLSENVQAAVEVEADTDDIRKAILNLSTAATGVLQDMALAGEQARQDIRETIGFSRVQQGEFQGKTHVTKAEVNQVMARSDIRMDERRDAVADLLTNVVRKFNQTVFTHWTIPQVTDIVGPDGAQYWLQYTGPEVAAEYNIKIDPSSSETLSPESKKADALEMANAWANMNMGAVKQGVPIPAEIQRYLFSQYEGINVDALLKQQGMRPTAGSAPQTPMPVGAAAQFMQRGGL